MHILLVHQYFLGDKDAGGSRWNQFSKYWAEQGHRVTVLAGTVHYARGKKDPKYKGRFIVRERECEGVEVLRCHVSESYNRSFIGRFWAYLSFAFSSIWAGLFKAGRADVILCTSPPLTVGLTGWILSKFKRIPMVFEVRDLWPESAIDTGVLTSKKLIKLSYWLEKKSYASSKWINVLTPAFEQALVENKGISPDMISMIPNGADLDILKPGERHNHIRKEHGLGDKFVVTYVGAHGVANHLIQLLEAAKLFNEDEDVVFMLVGDGMEKPMLKEKAAEWGLKNVVFVDSVPKSQIADYLHASDVCTAVLKRIDTFKTVYPNKVFDYMSVARPVLVGIDGVARKLIEDAGAGMYVEPENPEQYAAAVRKLKSDADLRRKCGESGLKFVQENFDRKVLGLKYLRILSEQVVGPGLAEAEEVEDAPDLEAARD